jgi:hypothetical protein
MFFSKRTYLFTKTYVRFDENISTKFLKHTYVLARIKYLLLRLLFFFISDFQSLIHPSALVSPKIGVGRNVGSWTLRTD